jgi:hypothetical protein
MNLNRTLNLLFKSDIKEIFLSINTFHPPSNLGHSQLLYNICTYICVLHKRAASAFGATGSKVLSLCAPLCVRVPTNLGAGEKDGRDTGLFASASNRRHSISQQKLCSSRISKEITPRAHPAKVYTTQFSVCATEIVHSPFV